MRRPVKCVCICHKCQRKKAAIRDDRCPLMATSGSSRDSDSGRVDFFSALNRNLQQIIIIIMMVCSSVM